MARKRTPVLNIFEGKDKEWYWHLKSKNGKIIAVGGEGFVRKKNAVRSSEKVLSAFAQPVTIHIEGEETSDVRAGHYIVANKGKDAWRWSMMAGNHKIIAHSGEAFDKRGNALRAINTFMNTASQPVLINIED